MENRDIIIVGQQPWDVEIGSNCKNIAVEFSKNNRVLYVNPPLDRITKHRHANLPKISKRLQVIAGKEKGLLKIGQNLWNLYPDCLVESINWIGNDWVFDLLNRYNNRLFAQSIKRAYTDLEFDHFVLFNDNDIFRSFYLKEHLKPVLSIYYSRDNMIATEYWRKHGVTFEPKLIYKSDICVANSEYLANYCMRFNQHSYYVGQGCEFDLFQDTADLKCPPEFAHLNRPVIGYVGALSAARLDIDLLIYIAKSKQEWNVMLVGPEDENFKKSELHQLSNVYFAGPKDPENLSAYINCFDVCINPQLLNALTIGNYPRKIDEYLAMGKPVVATKTVSMAVFSAHVWLAESKSDYINAITEALLGAEGAEESRKAFARSHSWENSVNAIYQAVEKHLK